MAHFTPPDISTLKHFAYIFGHPIAHSLSPLFHYTVFNSLPDVSGPRAQLYYESKSIPDFMEAIKDPRFFGASVTMPHKVNIIPYLDELTPAGQAIGAINTIFIKQGPDGKRLLCGTNTDCIGISGAISHRLGPEGVAAVKGKPALIVGGGGTCRAAVYALRVILGASTIYLVNRDKSEVDSVIEQCVGAGFGNDLIYVNSEAEAERLAAPAVAVSAIPDFPAVTDAEKLAQHVVKILLGKPEKSSILEMCYHPSPDTRMKALAESLGWDVIPGIEAMIYQGLEQDCYWLNLKVEDLPVAKVTAVVKDAISKPHL